MLCAMVALKDEIPPRSGDGDSAAITGAPSVSDATKK
jgi:hypothetical protein